MITSTRVSLVILASLFGVVAIVVAGLVSLALLLGRSSDKIVDHLVEPGEFVDIEDAQRAVDFEIVYPRERPGWYLETIDVWPVQEVGLRGRGLVDGKTVTGTQRILTMNYRTNGGIAAFVTQTRASSGGFTRPLGATDRTVTINGTRATLRETPARGNQATTYQVTWQQGEVAILVDAFAFALGEGRQPLEELLTFLQAFR